MEMGSEWIAVDIFFFRCLCCFLYLFIYLFFPFFLFLSSKTDIDVTNSKKKLSVVVVMVGIHGNRSSCMRALDVRRNRGNPLSRELIKDTLS